MAEVRLINAIPLEKEMLEYARYIGLETTNECESTAECCADMVREAPTIDQESLRGHAKWVKDKELKFIIVDDKNDSHEESAICCTHCKAKISQSDFDSWVWNFCPVCGCKMEDATNEQTEIS